jgi:hypothetical protein
MTTPLSKKVREETMRHQEEGLEEMADRRSRKMDWKRRWKHVLLVIALSMLPVFTTSSTASARTLVWLIANSVPEDDPDCYVDEKPPLGARIGEYDGRCYAWWDY